MFCIKCIALGAVAGAMSKYLLSLSVHSLYKCKLQVIRICKYLTCLMSVAHPVTRTNTTDTFRAVVSFHG